MSWNGREQAPVVIVWYKSSFYSIEDAVSRSNALTDGQEWRMLKEDARSRLANVKACDRATLVWGTCAC
jgi:hypothetical protein